MITRHRLNQIVIYIVGWILLFSSLPNNASLLFRAGGSAVTLALIWLVMQQVIKPLMDCYFEHYDRVLDEYYEKQFLNSTQDKSRKERQG
jgi:uncharacterized BrkB/YihY/UPF0761 family membrane protein